MVTNKKGYLHKYYHRERAKIIMKLGGVCQKCACTDNLEIHHIRNGYKATMSGAGQLARLCEWKKNINNLSLLCHEHHLEYHRNTQGNANHLTLFAYISVTGDLDKNALPIC